MSTIVTIGICTFRRPQIADTLASLAKLILPLATTLHIVIADNDEVPSAQVTVATAAAQLGFKVTYLHAPARNIAIARNACLAAATGDYLVFIDDDAFAEPLWLSELINAQHTTGADIAIGRVVALYPPYCPRWMLRGDFHATTPESVDGKITTGYSNNMLLKRSATPLTNLRFDEHFGANGGEDADFFRRALRAGASIIHAPAAIIYEPVDRYRATLGWLLRRRYRDGQVRATMLIDDKKPRHWNMLLASATMLLCYAMVILTCLMPIERRRWLLRGTLHLAVLRTLWHNIPTSK